jgi:hypothetical protein
VDLTNVVEALTEQRTRNDQAIAAIEGVGAAGRGRPHMSIVARERILEAMKIAMGKAEGKGSQEV